MVHNKPECVGATIHLATAVVDAGKILQQVRPPLAAQDSIHDMGNKTIIAAAKVLPAIVELYTNHEIELPEQHVENGFVCKRKDLNATAIQLMYDNFNKGMIEDYLKNETERNNHYPITDQLSVKK